MSILELNSCPASVVDVPMIVAVACFAGDTASPSELVSALPADCMAAFIFVQQTAGDHERRLTDALAKRTTLPVLLAHDGVVAEHGLGKRSELGDYRVQHRGGKGIITLKRTDRTGDVVALKEVIPDDELMVITRGGVIIRLPVNDIRVIGRNTQGVRMINLDEGDAVQDVARVVNEEEGGEEEPTGDVEPVGAESGT